MPRENMPLIGTIPDPAHGRLLGRRAFMAKLDATADLSADLTDDQCADRVRQARSRHFAELGRASARARAARREAQKGLSADLLPDDVAHAEGGRRERTA